MSQDLARFVRQAAAYVAFGAGLAACGSGGPVGDGDGNGNGGPPGSAVISGRITFDRLPFNAALSTGLNAANPVQSPARQVVVEAIDADTQGLLATTVTDTSGNYTVTIPAGRQVFIRAKAQMLKTGAAPTWDFSVRNNTNSDALYAIDGTEAIAGTGNSTRNLNAPSGWGTSSYTAERAAAPFAILDTVFRARELIVSASASAVFPQLQLFWSPDNRPTVGAFCPDDGDIGTSFYIGPGGTDQCSTPGSVAAGIYILGDFASDTDEFDAHVVAHEFGHYIEDRFGRSDSIGGDHTTGSRLELSVAFGEGWGNSYSAMVQADPQYRDSFTGVSQDFGFNLDADSGLAEGWFSEFSVGEVLWDIFDSGAEAGDTVALGFGPIFSVMSGAQTTTDALTSIFSFSSALRSANGASAAAITTLLNGEAISGTDDFGSGETNDGGDPSVLPVYPTITLNAAPVVVCTAATSGSSSLNKLGNRKFLRFANDATRLVTIRANGAAQGGTTVAATDPDIYVHRRGTIVAFGESAPPPGTPPGTPGTETISQTSLSAGTHVIEVLDFDLDGTGTPPRCMTVTIQG